MSFEIPGVTSFSNVPETTNRREEDEALGKTAFLELMIAQVKNQDPLEPAKNEAFIAQLAQFSSVEGIQNLNESMDSLIGAMRAGMTMDAASLVGRNVLVPTDQTVLNTNGGIGGSIELTEAVADLRVEIRDSSGFVVKRLDLGAQIAGQLRFDWDGITDAGNQAEQGLYTLAAFSDSTGTNEEFEINLPQQVVSVSINESGLVANLLGGASVPSVQIKEIQ